jgi:hypothetical protein
MGSNFSAFMSDPKVLAAYCYITCILCILLLLYMGYSNINKNIVQIKTFTQTFTTVKNNGCKSPYGLCINNDSCLSGNCVCSLPTNISCPLPDTYNITVLFYMNNDTALSNPLTATFYNEQVSQHTNYYFDTTNNKLTTESQSMAYTYGMVEICIGFTITICLFYIMFISESTPHKKDKQNKRKLMKASTSSLPSISSISSQSSQSSLSLIPQSYQQLAPQSYQQLAPLQPPPYQQPSLPLLPPPVSRIEPRTGSVPRTRPVPGPVPRPVPLGFDPTRARSTNGPTIL